MRDRFVHHLFYQDLTKIYDPTFISHSLSSRKGKGIHVGITALKSMAQKVSRNGKRPCYGLKMDIKRFFDSVDQDILKRLLRKRISTPLFLHCLDSVIDSFNVQKGKGIPLGNVTSQLFANLYLHPLDHYMKYELREKYYLRYCDDFLILSHDREHIFSLIAPIRHFLAEQLQLELHPQKVIVRKLSEGIDFIGYVLFSQHMLLRSRTKRRMKKRLKESFALCMGGRLDEITMHQKLQSYLGMLSHANQYELTQVLKNSGEECSAFSL